MAEPHPPISRSTAVVVAAVCGALALATFVGVTYLGDASLVLPAVGGAAWWLTALGLVLQSAALLWAGDRPRAVLVGTAAPVPLLALTGAADATGVGSLAVVTAAFLAASARPVGTLAVPLGLAAAGLVLGGALGAADAGLRWYEALGSSLVQALGTLVLVLLAASWARALRDTRRARAAQGQALAREQEALVAAAIARERTDMARELHDIAAHHLSGIAVLAGAVERQIDTDPTGAKAAVHQVRDQSTLVLQDLRRLVGLLRDRDTAPDARPETLAGIRDLVAEVAASGRDVGFTLLGDPDAPGRDVGPLAQLAAYRAVQEALANAGRHAPGAACRVTVDARAEDAVVVSVRNGPPVASSPPPAPGGGFGLVGMRERAQLTNADLETGPTDDHGWHVTMRLPKETATS